MRPPFAACALFAWAFFACGVPAPDPTGVIVCGRDASGAALCPNRFECRWGRCCPADSPMATCPGTGLLAEDRTGTAYEPAPGGTCPAGYAGVSGHCCLAGAASDPCNTSTPGRVCETATGVIDGTCGPAVTAEGMGACFGEGMDGTGERFSRGYCSRTCAPSTAGACGPLGLCVALSTAADFGYCYAQCTLHASEGDPCRVALDGTARYVCVRPGDARGAALPENRGICVPRCASSADCGAGRTCDGVTHACR